MPSTGTWEKACQGGQAPTSSVSSRLTKTHCLAVSVSDCRGELGFRVCTQAELSAQEEERVSLVVSALAPSSHRYSTQDRFTRGRQDQRVLATASQSQPL